MRKKKKKKKSDKMNFKFDVEAGRLSQKHIGLGRYRGSPDGIEGKIKIMSLPTSSEEPSVKGLRLK